MSMGGGKKNATSDLLDFLTQKTGCDYLSNLRQAEWAAAVTEILLAIDVDRYPPEQWRQALSYIIGQERPEAGAEQARRELLDHLSGQ